jgi:hypothetical protein
VAMTAPTTSGSMAFDLPWSMTGGKGIFGPDPVLAALLMWASLIGFALLIIVVAGFLSRWQSRRLSRAEAVSASSEPPLSPADRAQLRVEAGEMLRQAAVATAAAKHAATLLADTRTRREAAQQARESAWRAFEESQRAYETALRQAAALSDTPSGQAADTEADPEKLSAAATSEVPNADERDVSRAALGAFRRGDITIEELEAAFRQATGWGPEHEVRAREVEQCRVAESKARRLFQAAAAAERAIVTEADIAEVAATALAQEAATIATEARSVRHTLNASPRLVARQRDGKRDSRKRSELNPDGVPPETQDTSKPRRIKRLKAKKREQEPVRT